MGEDQISNGDTVVIIHISSERGQSAIGHAHGDRRHMLKVIRQGEQKDVHEASLRAQGETGCLQPETR